IGIFVPCLTVAFSLFCVTTRGLESSLPTPFASAAVMKKSIAKFGERWPKNAPLVGAPAPKLVFKGNAAVLPVVSGTGMGDVVTGLAPTAGTPPKIDRPPVVVPAKP